MYGAGVMPFWNCVCSIPVFSCKNYPWSPVSLFEPHLAHKLRAKYTVEKYPIHSSVCFLGSCQNTSDWGKLWVQLSFVVVSCTFTFAFSATMHCLLSAFQACLYLLRSPRHAQVACACCVTIGCKLFRQKSMCICSWFDGTYVHLGSSWV